jgi:hypothetical protein
MGCFGIGFLWLLLATVINKKFKWNLFWEYDPWFGWDRNGFEIAIILGWILAVPNLAQDIASPRASIFSNDAAGGGALWAE